MSTPVFIIHGVGNRVEKQFDDTARQLAERVDSHLVAHPVFWGDLGASYELIATTVPGSSDPSIETRDAAAPAPRDELSRSLAEFLVGGGGRDEVRDDDVPDPVLDAAAAAVASGPESGDEIRNGADAVDAAAVRAAITEHWPSTTWLPLIDDDTLLRAIGTAVGAPLADTPAAASGPGAELRDGGEDGDEARSVDVGGFVRRRLRDLDRVVGAAFGAAGGRVNSALRGSLLPGVTRAAGDVLVYQRHRAEIQDRVRSVIAAVDPDLGRSAAAPVDVLAHSLGGVITVDMATADEPLWIRRLVTFGSQAAFFHVCDPRGGMLAPYTGAAPVSLPASIGSWTNLWEPLDPVAFLAAHTFRLADTTPPTDVRIPHLASSGLWTHTDYWGLEPVAAAIRAALR